MKKTKKNNKGFSLVELIVVVLIMAIVAVALAPQVMKWVGHSRTATDAQTYDTLVENIQLALADEDVLAEVKKGTDITFTIGDSDSGTTVATFATNADGSQGAFSKKMDEVCGSDWTDKVFRKDKAATGDYVITVNHLDASVVRTTPPNTSNVK